MQEFDWNDLRHVLALAREGSLAAAGRCLGVDPTTVARRLRAIEQTLGTRLFERVEGALRPTEAGELAAKRAESVEAELGGLAAAVTGADASAAGGVRVTSVPLLVSHALVPAAAELTVRHPGLRLELISDPRDLSLTRREADVAMRLARPGRHAGDRILARRIGTLAYAAYVSDTAEGDATGLPWITYEEGMAGLPQARWIAAAAQGGDPVSPVAVNDAEALLQAVRVGLGRSLLPCAIAKRVPGLRRIGPEDDPALAREIWLLTHPDLRPLARIAAVVEWLEQVVRRLEADTG